MMNSERAADWLTSTLYSRGRYAVDSLRTQAISLLESVKNDSSVRQALAALARQDKDKYIQGESKRVLANLPDFE